MTEKQYQEIRNFALSSRWNRLYDSWGGVYAEKPEMQQHVLDTVKKINKTFGNTPHRNSVTLTVDIVEPKENKSLPDSPMTLLQNLWHKMRPQKFEMIQNAEEAMQPEDTAHSWRHNRSHFAFKSTVSGLELMGSVVHEGEHANQSDLSRYTSDELKIIAVFRAVNCSPEQNFALYQRNYNEMAARIQEAKLYLEVFEHAQQDPMWNMQEREFFLKQFRDLNIRLATHVGHEEIDALINFIVKGFRNTTESCDIINEAFDGESSRACNLQASQFMDNTGRDLHHQLCTILLKYSAELSKVIKQLERETHPELDRAATEQKDKRNHIIRRLQEENIQLVDISQVSPFPQGCVNVEYNGTSLEYAIQVANMYYNPALVQTSEGLCVIYDTQPCTRPYGPKPELPGEIQPEINEVVHDPSHIDVLEVDEWDAFDER